MISRPLEISRQFILAPSSHSINLVYSNFCSVNFGPQIETVFQINLVPLRTTADNFFKYI